jgi:hemerythrin-like metal-binding protein
MVMRPFDSDDINRYKIHIRVFIWGLFAMEVIEWNESYSVENEELDNQHQLLFDMINALFQAIGSDDAFVIMPAVIQDLGSYAVEHFRTEERYMAECEYPGLETQKQQHSEFCTKVSQWSTSYAYDPDKFAAEAVEYLYGWLTNHILSQDKLYAPYLKNLKKESSLTT